MVNNILVNFRGGMGDFILLTPTLRALFNDKRYALYFIGGEDIKNLVDGYGYFEKAAYINYKKDIITKCLTTLNAFLKFKGVTFSACLVPICTHGKLSFLITKSSKAKVRIGFVHSNTTNGCTHNIDITNNENEIKQNLSMLRILDIAVIGEQTELTVTEKNKNIVNSYLARESLDNNDKIFAIAPLNKGMRGYPTKEWPLEHYIDLIKKILAELGVPLILMGNKKEIKRLSKLNELLRLKNVHFQDKNFNIYDSAALLKKCSLLVCNDGGLMHVAMAINLPVVSIWGPTDPKIWGYLDKPNFTAVTNKYCPPCRKANYTLPNCNSRKCLNGITVDEVFNQCVRLLNESALDK